MRKALKWIGIGIGRLVGIGLLAVLVVYVASESRLNAGFDVPPKTDEFP